ncbi:MAG: UMP kinase [Mesorhizobium sp.]|nr:MAG: UMP kinase [Mesorhizobium sp.]
MREVPKPFPGPEDVLVRIEACGVCGTDRHLFHGEFPCTPPVTLGHEFSGIVEAVGAAVSGIAIGDRVTGDHMGMLATVINSLALRTSLNKIGVDAVVLSAIAMPELCESFSQRQATAYMNQGKVVIFAGGTGNPFFTTDSAAALRAAEIGADALFKGTQVDGVYSADPKKDPNAVRFDRISHAEVIKRGLAIMDTAAIALARENNIPIIVYSIHEKGGFGDILRGGGHCTVVTDK